MLRGIDVYVGDGRADWKKVRNAGVDFAIIKASQGYPVNKSQLTPFTDRNFEFNIREAHAAGIKCGAYHYLMAKTVEAARSEAEYFIKAISPFRELLDFPACVDIENDRAKAYSQSEKALNTDILIAFCETVEAAGFKSMIYFNPNFIKRYVEFGRLAKYDIWLAYYVSMQKFLAFAATLDNPSQITVWQYGSETVDGILKPTDGNIGYFDYSAKKGDVNGDGETDPLDASLILQYDAGLIELSAEQLRNADMNDDGEVDSADASIILQQDAQGRSDKS